MTKEVLFVFQDCVFGACSNRSTQAAEAAKKGITLRLTPFNAPGAKALILEAKSRGVGRLPFYTDRKKFSYNLDDFVPQTDSTDKPSRATKSRIKEIVKGTEDGDPTKA